MYTTQFSRKNPFDYQNLEKKCFRVWQLSTLVPIKMLVSSLTVLHTPGQTLGFSTVSKEQPLFKSVTRQNPVVKPILTVTIVTVNMSRKTGFSSINNLYKGCSLLTVLKSNVWQGVCSTVRLDTNIFLGTSVLNCQILETPFLQILVIKRIFSRKLGCIHFFSSTCWQNMSLYGQILLPKQLLQVPTCLLRPRPYLKAPSTCFFLAKICVY